MWIGGHSIGEIKIIILDSDTYHMIYIYEDKGAIGNLKAYLK